MSNRNRLKPVLVVDRFQRYMTTKKRDTNSLINFSWKNPSTSNRLISASSFSICSSIARICCITSCSSPNFGFSWKTSFILVKPSLKNKNVQYSYRSMSNCSTWLSAVFLVRFDNFEFVLGISLNVELAAMNQTVYSLIPHFHWNYSMAKKEKSEQLKFSISSIKINLVEIKLKYFRIKI